MVWPALLHTTSDDYFGSGPGSSTSIIGEKFPRFDEEVMKARELF